MTKISTGSRGPRSRAVVIAEGVVLPREVVEAFKQFVADSQQLFEQFGEIQEKFPNRWIAFFKGRVIATAQEKYCSDLMRRLRKKVDPPEQPVVEFIYAKGERPTFVLAVA